MEMSSSYTIAKPEIQILGDPKSFNDAVSSIINTWAGLGNIIAGGVNLITNEMNSMAKGINKALSSVSQDIAGVGNTTIRTGEWIERGNAVSIASFDSLTSSVERTNKEITGLTAAINEYNGALVASDALASALATTIGNIVTPMERLAAGMANSTHAVMTNINAIAGAPAAAESKVLRVTGDVRKDGATVSPIIEGFRGSAFEEDLERAEDNLKAREDITSRGEAVAKREAKISPLISPQFNVDDSIESRKAYLAEKAEWDALTPLEPRVSTIGKKSTNLYAKKEQEIDPFVDDLNAEERKAQHALLDAHGRKYTEFAIKTAFSQEDLIEVERTQALNIGDLLGRSRLQLGKGGYNYNLTQSMLLDAGFQTAGKTDKNGRDLFSPPNSDMRYEIDKDRLVPHSQFRYNDKKAGGKWVPIPRESIQGLGNVTSAAAAAIVEETISPMQEKSWWEQMFQRRGVSTSSASASKSSKSSTTFTPGVTPTQAQLDARGGGDGGGAGGNGGGRGRGRGDGDGAARDEANKQRKNLMGAYAMFHAGQNLMEVGITAAIPIAAAAVAINAFDTAVQNAANNTNTATQSIKDYEGFERNVITTSLQTSRSIEEVAGAYMRAANFGYNNADSLKIVTISNMAAVKSGANLEKTTQALVQTMHQFKIPVNDASRVMNVLDTVSDATNQRLEDFVTNSGRGMQAASQLGIGLVEAASSMGVLTESGMTSAQATTSLRSIINGIIRPTNKTKDEIVALSKATGVDLVHAFSAAGIAHYGLAGVLDLVTKATGNNSDKVKKLFVDQRNFIPLLTLLKNEHGNLLNVVKQGITQWENNSRVQGQYAEKIKSLPFILGQVRNHAEVLGEKYSKVLTPALSVVVKYFSIFMTYLGNLSDVTKSTIAITLTLTALFGILGGAVLFLAGKFIITCAGISEFNQKLKASKVAAEEQAAANTALAATEEGVAVATDTATVAVKGFQLSTFGVFAIITTVIGLLGSLAVNWMNVAEKTDDAARAERHYAEQRADILAGRQGEYAKTTEVVEEIKDEQGKLQKILAVKAPTGLSIKDEVGEISKIRAQGIKENEPSLKEEANARQKNLDDALQYALFKQKFSPEFIKEYGSYSGILRRQSELSKDLPINVQHLEDLKARGEDTTGSEFERASQLGKDILVKSFNTTPDKEVGQTCANWVSKSIMAAGVHLPNNLPINSAKALAEFVENISTQKLEGKPGGKSWQDALPGDIIVFHGGKFGAKIDAAGDRSGYHTGIYRGNGGIVESVHGKQHPMSIAAELAYGGPGATAVAYTIAPDYLTGNHSQLGDAITSTGKKGRHVLPKTLPYIPEELDIPDIDQQKHDYNEKLNAIDLAYETHIAKMISTGKTYDKYAEEKAEIRQKVVVASEDLGKVQKELPELSKNVTDSNTRRLKTAQTFIEAQKRYSDIARSNPANDVLDSAKIRVDTARKAYQDAKNEHTKYQEAVKQAQQDQITLQHAINNGLMRENELDVEAKKNNADKLLKTEELALAGKQITRGDYEKFLQSILDGTSKLGVLNSESVEYINAQNKLLESQNSRINTNLELHKQLLQLSKRDLELQKEEIQEEADKQLKAGGDPSAVAKLAAMRTAEAIKTSTDSKTQETSQLFSNKMETGTGTWKEMHNSLVTQLYNIQHAKEDALKIVESQFDKNSDEYKDAVDKWDLAISKMKSEIAKIDWKQFSVQAEEAKLSLEHHKISIEEYIAIMRKLQSTIPVTSEEYRKMADSIDAATSEINQKINQTAQGIAQRMSSPLMEIIEKTKTTRQAFRELFQGIVHDLIKTQIEKVISNQFENVLKKVEKQKQSKANAEVNAIAHTSVNVFGMHVNTMKIVVDTFGKHVAALASILSNSPANGSTIQSTTSAKGTTSPSTSASTANMDKATTNVDKATTDVKDATGIISNVTQNHTNAVQEVTSTVRDLSTIAKDSKWTQAITALSPVVSALGIVGAAFGIASLFGGGEKKINPSRIGQEGFRKILTDFSSTIDTSYFSGSTGLRNVLGSRSMSSAGISSPININIHEGAFQAHGVQDPSKFSQQALDIISNAIANSTRIDNARRGTG